MKLSTERILTTHVGSLPRPRALLEQVLAKDRGERYDQAALQRLLERSVADVVRRQAECGLDVVDDGEFSKPGFIHYVNQRLSGFAPQQEKRPGLFAQSRDYRAFPEYYAAQPASPAKNAPRLVCVGPIAYKGHALLAADIANLKAALAGVDAVEAFMPAVSPSNVEEWQANRYYETDEEYLFAIAEAMREEYKAIIDAGFVLQIDDPRLVTRYNATPNASIADCRAWAMPRIEALNHALRELPRSRIRFHTCYGINIGPRVHDMQLADVVDLILRVNAGAYSFEAANPRHEHEWVLWRDVRLPDDTVLIPGVITQSGVVVEHPELVAQRIERFASVVGRERVIAGADCGFGTFAGADEIDQRIVWAKLEALVQGARLASARLWR